MPYLSHVYSAASLRANEIMPVEWSNDRPDGGLKLRDSRYFTEAQTLQLTIYFVAVNSKTAHALPTG